MELALLLFAGYLLGSIPFGVIVGRAWRGVDVRQHGSGNIGFSNVLRVLGPGPAFVVLLGDAAKGFAPVAVGRALLRKWNVPEADLWLLAAALAPVIGHSFSLFLGFKGGRAVTTTCGALLALIWPAAVVGLLVWLMLVGITRYISVGSMMAAASVPAYLALVGMRWEWVAFWCMVAALVILRHLPNIKRLLARTETRIGERVKVETEGIGPDENRPSK